MFDRISGAALFENATSSRDAMPGCAVSRTPVDTDVFVLAAGGALPPVVITGVADAAMSDELRTSKPASSSFALACSFASRDVSEITTRHLFRVISLTA